MMTQTFAIFLDAYRELNSKKLFWIVLAISLAVVVAISLPGHNDRGITLLGLTIDFPFLSTKAVSSSGFYTYLFSNIGIKLWLTWGATILAIISTSSLIPDLVTSGSIELSLSKPIGRLRLFLTKYAAGLLFVAAQVVIFSLGAFLVIGLRGGKFSPSVFLAVPMVVAIYSFLFCVCALIGMLTRSALTAILGTMIFWLLLFSLNTTEHVLLQQRLNNQRDITQRTSQIEQVEASITVIKGQLKAVAPAEPAIEEPSRAAGEANSDQASAKQPPETSNPPKDSDIKFGPERRQERINSWRARAKLNEAVKRLADAVTPSQDPKILQDRLRTQEQLRDQLASEKLGAEDSLKSLKPWHTGFFIAKTFLPKTSESTGLLDRWVIDKSDIDGVLKMMDQGPEQPNRLMEEELNKRSVAWVLGTSLAFELAVLLLTGAIFVRRDF